MQKTQRRRKTPQFCTNTVANQRADQTTLCNKEAKRFKTCYGEQRRRRRMGKVVVSAPPKCAPRREACEGTEPVRRAEALAVSAAAAFFPCRCGGAIGSDAFVQKPGLGKRFLKACRAIGFGIVRAVGEFRTAVGWDTRDGIRDSFRRRAQKTGGCAGAVLRKGFKAAEAETMHRGRLAAELLSGGRQAVGRRGSVWFFVTPFFDEDSIAACRNRIVCVVVFRGQDSVCRSLFNRRLSP